jgi:peptidyl-tRNA hydrolase, PTH1 family
MIKLIAGLGNPGARYEETRHNLGFRTVDRLLELSPAKREDFIHDAMLFETEKYGLICKPMTFMNRSGKPLLALSQEFGLQPQEVLVLYDDFALQLGLIRVRARGSSGGHNGLQSIIEYFGTAHIPRIRMGIQTEEMESWVDFVLEKFRPREKLVVAEMLDLCSDAVEVILANGISTAMNRFNKKQKLDNGQSL